MNKLQGAGNVAGACNRNSFAPALPATQRERLKVNKFQEFLQNLEGRRRRWLAAHASGFFGSQRFALRQAGLGRAHGGRPTGWIGASLVQTMAWYVQDLAPSQDVHAISSNK